YRDVRDPNGIVACIRLVARRHGFHPGDLELLQLTFQPPQVLTDDPNFVGVRAQTNRAVIRSVLAVHKSDSAVGDQAGASVGQHHSQCLDLGIAFPTGGNSSALVLSVPYHYTLTPCVCWIARARNLV